MNDIFGFMYLGTFLYFFPIAIIIFVYITMLNYTKRNVINLGTRQHIIERNRQKREFRFILRILILVFILIFTSFPYLTFFLVTNIFHLPLPFYGHRVSSMFLNFGQSFVMLLTLIFTDDVRKSFSNILGRRFPFLRSTQVENINTIDTPSTEFSIVIIFFFFSFESYS